jgi:uncharacterized hydrophobic protein (TIGR00271 family)
MIKKIFLVTNDEKRSAQGFDELLQHIKIHYKITDIEIKDYKDIIVDYDQNSVTILYLNDEQIKLYLMNHFDSQQKTAILPAKDNQNALNSYGIPSDIYEALDLAFEKENYHKVDMLLCNSQIVFSNIIIGDVHGLNNTPLESQSLFSKLKAFYGNLLNLNFKDFSFETSKGHTLQTCATGVMVLEHSFKKSKNSFLDEELSLHDGKLNAFILAPLSKFAYLYYLFLVFFLGKVSYKNLPKSLGFIQTSKLLVSSSNPLDFKIDGVLISSRDIELQVKKDSLHIALKKEFGQLISTKSEDEEKDTVKTSTLPKGDMKELLINEPVPLFKKAQEGEFKELFLSLKQSAKLSWVFITLMILSTLLATTGLFQGSAPVIIGAMVLAPLMAPIVSLSMGVVRAEEHLIKNSSKTLFAGIVTALLFSCILTAVIPLDTLNDEMRSRLNPNLLDLIVAVISGIAGAYANSKSEVAKSLAGVAIAVALVPPLSVTGIGIGWGDLDIVYGSFLLFITNLVGITLSASLTFLVLGYAPIHRAKKGIVYTSVILAVITVPLIISFYKVIQQNNILSDLNKKQYILNSKVVQTEIVEVDISKKLPNITLIIKSEELLDKSDYTLLKKRIEKDLKTRVVLNISSKTVIR